MPHKHVFKRDKKNQLFGMQPTDSYNINYQKTCISIWIRCKYVFLYRDFNKLKK